VRSQGVQVRPAKIVDGTRGVTRIVYATGGCDRCVSMASPGPPIRATTGRPAASQASLGITSNGQGRHHGLRALVLAHEVADPDGR